MKRALTAFLAIATLSTIQASKPAYAVVGAATGNAPLAIGGAALASGAWLYNHHRKQVTGNQGFIDLGIALVGIILLDEKSGGAASFSDALTDQQAQAIGISAEELQAYRSELEEINAVTQSICEELGKMEAPSLEQSKALWLQSSSALSDQAFHAVSKISAAAIAQQ